MKSKASNAIRTFYKNVSKKYQHTYSLEQMINNVDTALDAIYHIDQSMVKINKQSITKTFKSWQLKGYQIASIKKWHYAYTIENDTIIVHDACHQQNNESCNSINKRALYEKLMLSISKIVKRELNKMRAHGSYMHSQVNYNRN